VNSGSKNSVSPEIPLQSRPLKVAVAEDNPDIRFIYDATLRQIAGFEVELHEDGDSLISAIDAFCPDVVILDYMMPVMDGLETTKWLKLSKRYQATPILFVTAKGDDVERQIMQFGEGVQVVRKPFLPEELIARIKGLVK